MLPSGVPNQPTSATPSFDREGSRTGQLMATVHEALETNLPKGPTKNVLGHTKKARAPIPGQQPQFSNTQAGPRGTDIDPVRALEELQYMKATYQQWIQYAASCGQGPEHETVKNWVSLARGIDAQIELVRETKRLFLTFEHGRP